MRVAELEVLFTADDSPLVQTTKKADQTVDRLSKKKIKVGADTADAVAGMGRVEERAKRLVSKDTAIRVNAQIGEAQKSIDTLEKELDYLRAIAPSVQVDADIQRAENRLRGAQRALSALNGERAEMVVDVDDSPARQKLQSVEDYAGEAGSDAGDELGNNLIAALVAIPVAGAVIGVGAAVGKALLEGARDAMNQEAGRDRLQALTGLDEASAGRLARAAGEAYANVFGDSIESNMDTARLALQFGILDADATTRDSQKVIQGLAGIADVLGEDVQPVAATVTTLLSTGVAKSAEEALDLIAAGARNGVNRADDLLDTFTEYPALFSRLGLSGPQALGLISQGLRAGARNSDLAADALKEFQIRATDSSKTSADGFRALGFNAEDMTARIAAGGESAREGLQAVLDKLRETEDPVARNAAAVALFGTQAEDLGSALFAMDLSSAVEELDGVTGSAQRMFDTLAGNDATKIEQAQRNIEVAADAIKGSLASALSEPIGNLADFVSQNRGPVLEFFRDLALGAIDFAESGGEGIEGFIQGPIAGLYEALLGIQKLMNFDPFRDWSGEEALLKDLRGFEMPAEFDETLDVIRDKITDSINPQIDIAYVNDAALRTAQALQAVEEATEGVTVARSGSVEVSREFADQIRASVEAMQAESDAAITAGESQGNLIDRWNTGRDALIAQFEAMGLTKDQAADLAAQYGAIPAEVATKIALQGAEEASDAIDDVARDRVAAIRISLSEGGRAGSIQNRAVTAQAKGSILEFMHDGGLTPMRPIAQMVPADTWRVVGDRSDVPEAFIPLDGSARSIAILAETIRRMPGALPMADGGILNPAPSGGGATFNPRFYLNGTGISTAEAVSIFREELREFFGSALGG